MGDFELTVEAAVERIRERNPLINAFVSTRLDEALAEAQETGNETRKSALHGVPFSLKDEWDTADLPTTGGSYRHRDRRPEHDSIVAEVFREAGAVLVGKSNLPDLGLPPASSNYIVGSTRNPHDITRSPGGSSGGAGAAVADGMSAFDWGTDIGGSIRLPAAFCGLFGLRLSSETWPLDVLFPAVPECLDWMCAQGPITRTLEQMRTVIEAAAPRLKKSEGRPLTPRGAIIYEPSNPGMWPSFADDVEPHIRRALDGEVTRSHKLPRTKDIRTTYGAVWSSHFEELFEADDTLGFWEAVRGVLSAVLFRGAFGNRCFHPETAELLLLITLGRYTIFRNRERALAKVRDIREAFDSAWAAGRLIVTPVCCYPAPKVGKTNRNFDLISCTIAGNITDATALAIPWRRFPDGMPRGFQLMGPPGSEDVLIELAGRVVESAGEAALP